MKYRLAASAKKLMQHKSLDRLSVSDIVEDCGVSRQTFYRCFQDKYDLVNWYFEVLVEESFQEMKLYGNLKEALIKKFDFIRKEGEFFYQAFSSDDQNSLFHYDYQYILSFYTEILEEKLGAPLEEELTFLLQMYCRGSIYMTVEWIKGGMQATSTEMSQYLVDAMPDKLKEVLYY